MSGSERLARRLGTTDAVSIGLGAMLGAGVFMAFAPAAQAAGEWLLVALVLAAGVAYCNAVSSARLAARYPESGGTYVYGRRRLGDFWGFLAGWSFVVGKTASCAAMALTAGAYAAPGAARPLAVAAVVACTGLNLLGVARSAAATRGIVGIVLLVLSGVVAICLTGGRGELANLSPRGPFDGWHFDGWGVAQAAGFLFFAFAGYARIATLGEEVRDPGRTIPRAIRIALAGVLLVYAAVGVAVLAVLGPDGVAASRAPLADAVASVPGAAAAVRGAAALAALGALLALILGVSRTTLAMARDGHLPGRLRTVHPRHQVPVAAELAVGLVVVAVVLAGDARGAIAFSSFGVLVYYAVANASALTLDRSHGSHAVPVLGLIGCAGVAAALPWGAVRSGLAVLAVGAAVYAVRRHLTAGGTAGPAARPPRTRRTRDPR